MKVYTRGGDKGKTGIHGGARVEKDDIRIEANGSLDELNSVIGMVRVHLAPEDDWQQLLYRIQNELMEVMSHVATPSAIRDRNPNILDAGMAVYCEEEIDRLTDLMGESRYFILPGGNITASWLHLARTAARLSERRLCTLHRADPLPEIILQFVNRLSDLFFVMARYELYRKGNDEEQWKDFRYKRKS